MGTKPQAHQPWHELGFWNPSQSQEETQSIHLAKRLQVANTNSNIPQLITIVRPRAENKMDQCFLSSPTTGSVLGQPTSIGHCITFNLQVEEKLSPYEKPLTCKDLSRKESGRGVLNEDISWVNQLSLWLQLVYLLNCRKMWISPCVHVNWDHKNKTPLCPVSHCHLGRLWYTGLWHV